MGIMNTFGVLDAQGKITDKAREEFVSQVQALIGGGYNGETLFNSPISVPGILFPGLGHVPGLEDKEKFPIFHKIYVDFLLQETAKAFNVQGAEPFFPVCDPTAFGKKLGIPVPDISLGEALSVFPVPNPLKMLELLQVSADDIPGIIANLPNIIPAPIPGPPSLPAVPSPNFFIPSVQLPSGILIPTPSLPGVPVVNLPAIPGLLVNVKIPSITAILGCILSKIPLIIVGIILASSDLFQSLPGGPAAIVAFFVAAVLDIILTCFVGLPLSAMTAFLAAIVIYIKDLIIMIILAMLASLIGDGLIVTGMANFLGLI